MSVASCLYMAPLTLTQAAVGTARLPAPPPEAQGLGRAFKNRVLLTSELTPLAGTESGRQVSPAS